VHLSVIFILSQGDLAFLNYHSPIIGL